MGKLNGSFHAYLQKLRLTDAVTSLSPQSWKRYIGHFGNWIHFHDHLQWENAEILGPLEVDCDPPLYEKLRVRQRDFASWEKWKGNVSQSIGTCLSGAWRVHQALFPFLQPLKALADRAIAMTRMAANRTNRSKARPILMIPLAAVKKIYAVYTKVDGDGYPIFGVELYTGPLASCQVFPPFFVFRLHPKSPPTRCKWHHKQSVVVQGGKA